MRAIRLFEPGKPVKMQEVDIPRPGPEDVLIRVAAAGICHSDAHYRSGMTKTGPLPVTLGHEIAGVVEEIGSRVAACKVGDRVCVHYLVSCGRCHQCNRGCEQFCSSGQMIGKHRDGGMADYICVPYRSAVCLPVEIAIDHGAVMMCSSSTSLHALRKARVQGGDTVAIFGIGGLGASAVQLARALGALQVFAVDINPRKLELAKELGSYSHQCSGSGSRQGNPEADGRQGRGCLRGSDRLAAHHETGCAVVGRAGTGCHSGAE